jgi:hypothetical protein
MMHSARMNSQWIALCKEMLRVGYGVEDIADRLACSVKSVRMEVSILRETGELKTMFERAEK